MSMSCLVTTTGFHTNHQQAAAETQKVTHFNRCYYIALYRNHGNDNDNLQHQSVLSSPNLPNAKPNQLT